MPKYIWEKKAWPIYTWDASALIQLLGDCRYRQGALFAKMGALGVEVLKQTRAEILIEEALKTSAIENLNIDPTAVRSSVASRLGLPTAGLPAPDRNRDAEGIVQILLDATENHRNSLTLVLATPPIKKYLVMYIQRMHPYLFLKKIIGTGL